MMNTNDVRLGLVKCAAFGAALSALVAIAHPLPAGADEKTPTATAAAVKAPDFTLSDVYGVKHKLSDYRGVPVALYFFCGCEYCHRAAGYWEQMRNAGALPTTASGKPAATVVVFSGDAAGVKQFVRETGMDLHKTTFLTDEDLNVTLNMYNAEPCPHVVVLDPAGNEIYVNNHKDDQARQAPEMVIVSRALDALRKAAAAPPHTKA